MKNYKLKLKFLVFLVFSLLIISPPVFASTTDGKIDPIYRYGWGENIGWVDFGSTAGAVHITDSAFSGFAYSENIGWINLSGVVNDKEGNLSGHAWGENVGFIDFSKVTIGIDGIFSGSAYGENIGWITFGTINNKIVTDWRPASSRTATTSHSSSGSYLPGYGPKTVTPITNPSVVTLPATLNTPCSNGALFNTTTGLPCSIISSPTTNLTSDSNNQTSILIRTLKFKTPRMIGNDVKELQTYLNTHLYNCGLSDGIFGNLTKQAVIKFQLVNQLKRDGVVGPLTKEKLK